MKTNYHYRHFLYIWLLSLVLGAAALQTASASQEDVWTGLKNGSVVALMRHAIAPGNGDPTEFTLGDCSTQRNLSEEGRQQAQAIGAEMKLQGISQIDIYSSQWCRCVDTGTELGFSAIEELPFLNSFYQDRSTAQEQTEQLRVWLINRLESVASNTQASTPAILVTHQVNITGLTGVFPSSGEIVFLSLDNGDLKVVTSIVVPH